MHFISVSCFFFCLAIITTNSWAAPITYSLLNFSDDQNGHTLSGSITAEDINLDGFLTKSEIVEWNWTITGSVNLSASSSDTNAGASIAGDVLITASSISLIPLPNLAVLTSSRLTLSSPFTGQPSNKLDYYNGRNAVLQWSRSTGYRVGSSEAWSTSPAVEFIDSGYTVASTSSDVPEPSALVLFSFGMMGFVGYQWRNRRKTKGQ